MKKHIVSDKVSVGESNISGAGRGVFAKSEIKKGELIERCPFLEIPESEREKLNESFLVSYFFYFGKNKEKQALLLGFGSMYNHSYKPNASFKIKKSEGVVEFVALKNIKKSEEILFNYKGDSKNKAPLWFEV